MKRRSCAMTNADNAGVEAPGGHHCTNAASHHLFSLDSAPHHQVHYQYPQEPAGPAAGRSRRGDRKRIPTPLIPAGTEQGRGARERQAEDRWLEWRCEVTVTAAPEWPLEDVPAGSTGRSLSASAVTVLERGGRDGWQSSIQVLAASPLWCSRLQQEGKQSVFLLIHPPLNTQQCSIASLQAMPSSQRDLPRAVCPCWPGSSSLFPPASLPVLPAGP